MKLVCASDIHGKWSVKDWLNLPEGDVLLLAGDILANYSSIRSKDAIAQKFELDKLDCDIVPQLKTLKGYKAIILIAGNHDWIFRESDPNWFRPYNLVYLQDQQVVIDGVKFYGFPWQPRFFDWNFNVSRNSHLMEELVGKIPSNVNVLISHGPPFGYGDLTPRGDRVGCEVMAEKIKQMPDLFLHVFGHIHLGYGVYGGPKPIFANASICNEKYQPVNKPLEFTV